MKKTYECLYNHDMGSIPQCLTPALTSCEQQVTREQVQQFVRDVADTNVDAVLCCPTMLRRVLWRSEIDPYWRAEHIACHLRHQPDPSHQNHRRIGRPARHLVFCRRRASAGHAASGCARCRLPPTPPAATKGCLAPRAPASSTCAALRWTRCLHAISARHRQYLAPQPRAGRDADQGIKRIGRGNRLAARQERTRQYYHFPPAQYAL